MHTKRFVAADMRRALTLVRDELGEDAMILSTQRTGKGVEIIATSEAMPMAAVEPTAAASKPFGAIPARGPVPQVKAQVSANSFTSQQSRAETYRGPASGKTQGELAQEIEDARRRMLAMQKEENLTLTEWADRQPSSQKLSSQKHAYEPTPASSYTPDVAPVQRQYVENGNEKSYEKENEKDNEEIRRLQDEIASMRSLFENQLSLMAEAQERHFQDQQATAEIVPLMADVKQRLSKLGLTQACSDQLIRSLKNLDNNSLSRDQLWMESLARLARKLPVITRDPVATGGIYAFLGTTGVGKTTTIAKLAARYVMEHGPEQVALLTTDTYRIAAHDQLRSLSRILKVPFKVVDDLNQLPKMLNSFSKQALVLIDTPGMSYNDPLLKPHLTALRRCRQVQSTLVLSANSQYQMMQASLHSYRIANPRFCVMTKLDECASLGDAISLLTANDLSLAYITNGQAVPDDLAVIKPHQLVTTAVKLSSLSARAKPGVKFGVKERPSKMV